ncbi:MAG TPA: hypothetical protein VG125_29020 [Pirellulales bacterium]|nr:hypothetical protein [Pirellulales bacterium]
MPACVNVVFRSAKGDTRSGKGTIARIQTALVGKANVLTRSWLGNEGHQLTARLLKELPSSPKGA